MPSTQIVAMAVLPKGETWPNTCSAAVAAANARLQAYALANKQWLHFLDVGDKFLTHVDNGEGRQDIVPSLLTADTISPSFYGMRVIVKELVPLIDALVQQKPSKSTIVQQADKIDRQTRGKNARLERSKKRRRRREKFSASRKMGRDADSA